MPSLPIFQIFLTTIQKSLLQSVPPPQPPLHDSLMKTSEKKIKAFEEANSFLALEQLQIKMDRTFLPSGVQEHYDEKDK
ncbi:Hypothetical protein FKW44_000419 [Caligus rogercresseyi]|uniref:Uncharacterized protein n=1 Tax=Caligus rogercresseyi TaxID=217165 RepID=A0A7T8QUU6_CALRO|nr:Hypothetical protein FKW44_000419 [Caligus rogercresseyi]